ncbi:MAG: hypothetical protein ACLFSM_07815 [Thermoplasmata archaeon]
MTGELLNDDLEELKGKRLLIVMDDGLSFLGKLIDFDNETLKLEEVYQTNAKEINWKDFENKEVWGMKPKVRDIGEKSQEKGEKDKVGYVEWVEVNLDRLYIRIDHVVRIWYEDRLKRKDRPPSKSTVYSKT